MSVYKAIPGWPGYSISRTGIVLSIKRGKPKRLSIQSNKDGYLYTTLCRDGKQKAFTIHRLIAIVWIPNPEGKPCINHKNSKRGDNRISNLEWCTYSENSQHAERKGRMKHRLIGAEKAKRQVVCKRTGTVYSCLTWAARCEGVTLRTMWHWVNNKNKRPETNRYKYLEEK